MKDDPVDQAVEGAEGDLASVVSEDNEGETESTGEMPNPNNSYSMFAPRIKRAYRRLYKDIYFTPEESVLEPKVHELISIAASMVAQCEGCLDGHIKKALKLGVTKEEISEAMSIAVAVNGAAMIDESDRAAARLGLNLFPWNQAIKR